MKNKIVIMVCAALLVVVSAANAGAPLKINNRDVQEGQALALFKDDLDGGKLVFSTPADDDAAGADISLDGGRRWEKMEREAGRFVYVYRPRDDEKMNIVFMFKKASGATSLRSANVTIYYQKLKPDQAIMAVLEKMKAAYEGEQKARFMDLFSMRFPNRIQFEESIQNDFYNYNNIRLFYRIERQTNDPDYRGAIWDIWWERKCMDRNGNSLSSSAQIAMKFSREMDQWLISAMNGNTIFGSSLLASAELVINSSDLTMPSYQKIQAVIHNTGDGTANNFNVQFYVNGTLANTQTVSMLSGNASATLFYTTVAIPACLVRVVVDPEQRVPEADRSNNEASKTLNFP